MASPLSTRLTLEGLSAESARDLVERHSGAVYRVALRLLGDAHEAEDITQEVLLRLCHTRANLRPGSDEGAWAYSITINLCRDILRSHRRRVLSLVPLEDLDGEDLRPTPDLALDRARRERQVQLALQRLPANYREVLVLRDMEGQPYKRLCEVLGLSESNLKARVIRARRALARALLAEDEEESP